MKHLLTLTAFLILSGEAFAQNYNNFAYEFFMFHQPNARAEAMGRGNGAVPGGSFQTYYNAAASSFTEGANAAYTKVDPRHILADNWYYYNYGASYNTGKYGAAAFNYFRYTYNEITYTEDPSSQDIKSFDPYGGLFALNYSYKFKNDFALGINTNFFHYKLSPKAESKTFFFDIGAIKKIPLGSGAFKQDVYAAASFNNILNTKTKTKMETTDEFGAPYIFEYIDYMPSLLRLSGAYEITYKPEGWKFTPASFIASAECQDMLNSKYYTMVKFGAELTFMEIFKGRIGYYTENNNDYGNSVNASRINEVTFGFGVSLPIYKLAPSVPLEINADYVNLKNPAYNTQYEDYYKYYNLFTVSLNARI